MYMYMKRERERERERESIHYNICSDVATTSKVILTYSSQREAMQQMSLFPAD